jgi:hypothetical protein
MSNSDACESSLSSTSPSPRRSIGYHRIAISISKISLPAKIPKRRIPNIPDLAPRVSLQQMAQIMSRFFNLYFPDVFVHGNADFRCSKCRWHWIPPRAFRPIERSRSRLANSGFLMSGNPLQILDIPDASISRWILTPSQLLQIRRLSGFLHEI